MQFLVSRNIHASFIPQFYGAFEADGTIGFEQECFLEKSRGGDYDTVVSLNEFIRDPASDLSEINKLLSSLKAEMIKTNIIISDLRGPNILYVVKDSVARLVIIDGYGTPEIIPFPQYIRFLGKMKIERQWNKLMDRLKSDFELKLKQGNTAI